MILIMEGRKSFMDVLCENVKLDIHFIADFQRFEISVRKSVRDDGNGKRQWFMLNG